MNWRNQLRGGLILLVVVVTAAITAGLRERPAQSDPITVQRTDPEAVIQTRGSRIRQADLLGENVRVIADRQEGLSRKAIPANSKNTPKMS